MNPKPMWDTPRTVRRMHLDDGSTSSEEGNMIVFTSLALEHASG